MVHFQKTLSGLLLFSLFSSVILTNCDTTSCQAISQNLWQPRSFSSYKTREIIALQNYELQKNILSVSFEYMQSFGNDCDRLGALPFWSGTNTMTIGSNDGKSNLDAYQFGLGKDIIKTGSITLKPEVQHVGGELLWRILYSSDEPGVYGQVKIPLGAMMMRTKIDEDPAIVQAAQDSNWARYPELSVRFKTIQEALISNFEHRAPDYQYGRLCWGRNSVVRCGDIEVVGGYNFQVSDNGYFGAGFKVSCPTGSVPQAKFLLEPIFGRAGYWGVGADVQGSYDVYENEDMILRLSFRGDILHLFSGRTPNWRSLDLKLNGPGSKYLLLQRYFTNLGTMTMGSMVKGEEFRSSDVSIIPAINITTVPVLSTIPIEGSFALAIAAQQENWNLSLIAEFWGRSQESLQLDCLAISKLQDAHLNDYAVLGRQIDKDYAPTTAVNLYLCEPKATIGKSADRKLTPGEDPLKGILDAKKSINRIPANYKDALDVQGAQAPRALTGKITAEFGYTWLESDVLPHVSIFGGLEFADTSSKFMNLWSVGMQGSVSF